MTAQPVACPLCSGVDLVPHPRGRFECATAHGFYRLQGRPGPDGGTVDVVLHHETSGLEYAVGNYTAEGWSVLAQDAGMRET